MAVTVKKEYKRAAPPSNPTQGSEARSKGGGNRDRQPRNQKGGGGGHTYAAYSSSHTLSTESLQEEGLSHSAVNGTYERGYVPAPTSCGPIEVHLTTNDTVTIPF